jgi:t-SNARE complex subunit (syntaxin)
MVLDHTKVVYMAEDEQGFTFRQINDEDAAVELRARRKKRNRWVLIAFVALLIGMVVSTFLILVGVISLFVCIML